MQFLQNHATFSLTKRNLRENREWVCPSKCNFRRKPGVFYSSKRKGGFQTKILHVPKVKAGIKRKFGACPEQKTSTKRKLVLQPRDCLCNHAVLLLQRFFEEVYVCVEAAQRKTVGVVVHAPFFRVERGGGS